MSNGAQIRNCLFQGNTANDGGAMVVRFDSSATITNTEFISNTTYRYGGALLAEGLVTIDGCRFEGNHADQEGGAINHPIGNVLTVSNTTFIRNNADVSGGALRTRQTLGASLDGCVFEQNSAALGGAIFGQEIGRLSLSSCSLSSNHADQDGGALYVTQADRLTLTDTDVVSNTANNGGGISGSAGQVVITGTLLEGNVAANQGGALNLHADLIVTGTQVISNICGTLGGGAWVWGDTTIYGTRFEDNQAGSAWGALGIAEGRLLDVAYSQFVGNQAGDVGALFMSHGTLDGVLFAGNSATTSVGACSVGGPVTITNSSFVSNTSQTLGMLVNTQELTMLNTTLAGNISTGAGPGAIQAVGPLTLTHCTIANNASESGAGGVNSPLAGATLIGTIVARNTSGLAEQDVAGAFTSGGHNLIGITNGATGFSDGVNGDLVGSSAAPLDPLLGALDDARGDTPTLPLLPGSPSIDAAGDDAPALDQRGLPRLGRADIGAFEARGFTLSALSGDGQRAPVFSVFTLPLVVGVTSAWGDPVDGGLVTFSAPPAGPSARLSPSIGRILGGQTSVVASANGLTGTYAVEALARGARPAGFVYRVDGVLEAPQARDVVVEPTVPLNPSVTPTITPAATPMPTLPPVMMEPLAFTLENVASEQRQGLWLPMVFK
jgi:predicted outer membrane repeat protein